MDEFEALALAAAAKKKRGEGAQPAPTTNIVEQAGSGLNEGLASFAGTPVDMMTGFINGLVQRPQFKDTTDYSQPGLQSPTMAEDGITSGIAAPFGGSDTFKGVMDPFISDTAPQTMGQRYARRGGQEIGFGVPAALTGASLSRFGAPAREALAPYMATSLAGDAGAAVAGQTSREIAPDSALADIVASLLGGGGAALGASGLTPKTASVPTIEASRAAESNRWDKVNADTSTLTDAATADLQAAVRGRLPQRQTAAMRYPNATAAADDLDSLVRPRMVEVEDMRRSIGDTVAADPKEARLGSQMKAEISAYLDGLKPADVVGDPAIVDDLTAARRLSAQNFKYDAVANKEMRGESRAATSGSGGNEVNATRQNLRALLDKERDPTLRGKRQGFTPDEMAALDKIVMGTTGSNLARNIGKLSPASGVLPMMATGGGLLSAGAGLATGNPLMTLAALPAAIGAGSKAAAESMTKGQIEALLKTILNGGKAPGISASRTASRRAIVEQLLSTAGGNPQ